MTGEGEIVSGVQWRNRPPCARAGFRWLLAISLLCALLAVAVAGCTGSLASGSTAHPQPSATPDSPLAHETVYWSQNQWLWAHRASDGRLRWQVGHWTGPGPGCTVTLHQGCAETYIAGPYQPTLVNGVVYATSIDADYATPELFAFDAASGAIHWHVPLQGCLMGAAPVVVDDVIYLTTSGHANSNFPCGPNSLVYALRPSDGVTLWKVPLEPNISDTPAVSNGVVVVATNDYPAVPATAYLTALRASDGTRLWRLLPSTSNTVMEGNGVVVVSGTGGWYGGKLPSLRTTAYRQSDGHQLWSVQTGSNDLSVPLMAQGMIFVQSAEGDLYALREGDGSIAWRFHTGAEFAGAPALFAGDLYLGAGPSFYMIDASTGALVRSFPLFTRETDASATLYSWSRPAVTDAAIYVSVGGCSFCRPAEPGGTLLALDTHYGIILWQHGEAEGLAQSAPVVGP